MHGVDKNSYENKGLGVFLFCLEVSNLCNILPLRALYIFIYLFIDVLECRHLQPLALLYIFKDFDLFHLYLPLSLQSPVY
jgi:hypothetical protein